MANTDYSTHEKYPLQLDKKKIFPKSKQPKKITPNNPNLKKTLEEYILG